MNTWAVILAAGRGLRSGRSLPKQFLPYRGMPLFRHSLSAFARISALRGLVLVLPPDCDFDVVSALIRGAPSLGLPCLLRAGGESRQESSALGAAALPADCEAVLIHDAARPFVTASLIIRVLEALEHGCRAVIPGIAVTDTLKEVDAAGMVGKSIDRACLRAVQTPQGFVVEDLKKAHEYARNAGVPVTDDAGLMELCGIPVTVVPGDAGNVKITTPEDLRLLSAGSEYGGFGPAYGDFPMPVPRSGFGYDVHRYGGNRPLVLGGVPIPCDITVHAHSDGDVLLHALADALLGCICGGDIGLLFPDSDPNLENIASGILLTETLERCLAAGFHPEHADMTVIAQVPRIAPYRDAVADNIAKLLRLDRSRVNLKATTEEKLGFTGEKKGIKATALVNGFLMSAPGAGVRPCLPRIPLGGSGQSRPEAPLDTTGGLCLPQAPAGRSGQNVDASLTGPAAP
ncbi:MAG: 2-C-methyl-D-erythritol 4-phosphate cytidylyltransferase [Desulfovibrio sp.]|jgi:2-C-methyl-D-erythritol 4-phosphate cytidylyltransferase/2-C-methyl-D-erythritol 2,4-cyclodiphosphate synthase|nr:2-C-methyl-D-erythritol 4-phosphate cytidylyltransferase [Desulfovibrio sp.]